MDEWLKQYKFDPLKPLLESRNEPIKYFAGRDLLGTDTGPVEALWQLPIPQRILRKQQPDGSWQYPTKTARTLMDYSMLETYRELGFLVEMFGFNKSHPAVQSAAEYLLSKQTDIGDLRGNYGRQYSPNYTAGIIELLVKAGYGDDRRVRLTLTWLLESRQHDGGWAIPIRTKGCKLDVIDSPEPVEADRTKPSSYWVTGVVLRAFAAHPDYLGSTEVKRAGEVMLGGFFKKDPYPDRNTVEAWTRFSYPFWWTDLISALDTLSRLGFRLEDDRIGRAVEWLLERQKPDGTFDLHMLKDRYHDLSLWLDLSVCRVVKRFSPGQR